MSRYLRPILESEILRAQDESKSASETARKLGVCYNTYKKYAELYGVFDRLKNPTGIGIKKAYNIRNGKYALEDIMAGQWPNYPTKKFQRRLIDNLYLEEKCYQCGYDEERVLDLKIPVKLDFIDGNKSNRSLKNLRLLCFNCYFVSVGDLR